MKRFKTMILCMALFLGFGFIAASQVNAADYTVALTTYVPTASSTDFTLGAYPNISGGVYPQTMILANTGSSAQLVTWYDTATSSTAATVAGYVVVPASGTAPAVVDFNNKNKSFKLTSPAFTKSSTAGTVYLTILYD